MEQPEPLHPANAEAIAEFAEETGAEVLRGALRYPSDGGGWQLGDIDFSEDIGKYRDQMASLPYCQAASKPCLTHLLLENSLPY